MTYLLHRVLWTLPVVWGVVTLVFLLVHLVPGDPAQIMLGENALPGDVSALRSRLELDRPLAEQYGLFLGRVLRGDVGRSFISQRPVAQEIAARLPATAELMVGAMAVALALAFPLGVTAALYHGRWPDRLASLFALLGVAMPSFWLGPMLILLFAIRLDWLPVNERGGLDNLVLPAVTLGTALAALLSRMIHASLLEVMGEDYIRTARAKGLGERAVVWGHAMGNALIPVVTVAGLQIGVLLSGAIITESIFDWPGLGTLLLDAINTRDYPVVQGCVLTISITYILVNLATDLLYGWLDPRIRLHR
ncbi:MAG: ABC transporter permease [Deltaproteobacteria bacterium]|nr:ABC transporter permease [Deltaproteobacteria bacterium]